MFNSDCSSTTFQAEAQFNTMLNFFKKKNPNFNV